MKDMEYFEKDGELWFSYEERISLSTKAHAEDWRIFECSERIPKKIRRKGKKAIKKYVEERIEKRIKEQKNRAGKQDRFAANPNFTLEIKGYGVEGVTLRGRTISAEDSVLTVRLEEPFIGEDHVIYGFASAIAGHYIFADLEKFSENAISSAYELLVRIYKREKHRQENKEVIDLAEQMNETVPCYGGGGG